MSLKKLWPILLLFSVVGAAFLTAASILAFRRYAFLQTAIEYPGEVIKIDYQGGTGYPVVLYEGPDGKGRTLRGGVGSLPASFNKGEKVIVVVDPNDADYGRNAQIKSPVQLWGVVAFCGFMGSAFLAFPSMLWLKSKSMHNAAGNGPNKPLKQRRARKNARAS